MAIRRVYNVERGYTIVLNDIFHRDDLSYRAKGLYCQMWSLPDAWVITTAGLVTMSKDGKDAVAGAIRELEDAGFLVRTQARDESGTFSGWDFDLFQSPEAEKPAPVNPQLSNTITPLISNRSKKEGSKKEYGEYKHVRLTDKEYQSLQDRFPTDFLKRIKKLDNYIESKGVHYQNHYRTILNWADMDEERKAEKKADAPIPKYQQFLDLAKELENEQR